MKFKAHKHCARVGEREKIFLFHTETDIHEKKAIRDNRKIQIFVIQKTKAVNKAGKMNE